SNLAEVLSTLRNGFSHFHWRYVDESAADYFTAQGWQDANDSPAFARRATSRGHISYVVNSTEKPWDPSTLWSHKGLQILVTPYTALRGRLFTFLNYFLNGEQKNLWGENPATDPD